MKVRAAVCSGLHEPWKTEEVEIDEPHAGEVLVTMAYSGMCHSDEHLRTGDISQDPEVLQLFGVDSMFPCIGGHEGAGIVEAVGENVTSLAPGDQVAVSFVPACGRCEPCASGKQYLCDLTALTLAGPMMSDMTWRHHLDGQNVNRMAQLGTSAPSSTARRSSRVRSWPSSAVVAWDPEPSRVRASVVLVPWWPSTCSRARSIGP